MSDSVWWLKLKIPMFRIRYFILPAPVLLFLCLGNSGKDEPSYLSPADMAYSPGQGKIYIAEHCGRRIDVFDTGTKTITRTIPLADHPNNVYLTGDQRFLLISQGMADGRLLIYDLENLKREKVVPAGHSPTVITESRKHIILCHRFPGQISFLDRDGWHVDKTIAVGREPVAMVAASGRQRLFVAHHLPEMAATADHVAAKISVIDLGTLEVIKTILLPNGSSGVKGITIDPEQKHLFVTHILARYQLPPTQLERGWMNTNAMTIIDVDEMECRHTILLDDIDHGAANPWDVECSEDGQKIFVSHAGTHELSIIDWGKLKEALAREENTHQDLATSEDLGFIYAYRKRLALNGNGPRAILCDGQNLYVAHYFTDNLSIIDLATLQEQSIPLAESTLSDERLGEMYFNDASLCFQSWQGCASCHPDGRVDGLNWDLLNDGIGNPKNAKSLLLSHQTPPAMSLGVRSSAEEAVRAGFRYIQFATVEEEYATRVDAYLQAMQPVESPYPLSKRERGMGEQLFHSLDCKACHPAPLYTDLHAYSLGGDTSHRWDTPTLVEIWRSGPYWHDGRYASLQELFEKEKHGLKVPLSHQEIRSLEAYLLTL